MKTNNFKMAANAGCKPSSLMPDEKSINTVIASSKKEPLEKNAIIIARYGWLKKNNLPYPEKMELPNLCLTVSQGKLIRAFYCNVMTHIIKKQNYHIQVLN